MVERTEDGFIEASFEIKFTVPYQVANINDSFLNEAKVREVALAAGKAAAAAEIERQLAESLTDGTLEEGMRVERGPEEEK
jgi:hypothetical protein